MIEKEGRNTFVFGSTSSWPVMCPLIDSVLFVVMGECTYTFNLCRKEHVLKGASGVPDHEVINQACSRNTYSLAAENIGQKLDYTLIEHSKLL